MRRRSLIYVAAIVVVASVGTLAGALIFFSPLAAHYIQSDAFRRAMENATAKGLHFPAGRYAPIRRTGALTARSERFQASNGEKALKRLDARGITAKFDPWGVFLRQWRFDEVHVQSGEVEIQIMKRSPRRYSASRGSQFFCQTGFISSGLNRSRLM